MDIAIFPIVSAVLTKIANSLVRGFFQRDNVLTFDEHEDEGYLPLVE